MIKNNLSVKFKMWFFHKYFDNGTLKVESFEERVLRSNKPSRRPSKRTLLLVLIVAAVQVIISVATWGSDNGTFIKLMTVSLLGCSFILNSDVILNFFSSNIFKTVNSFHSFKSPTWTLRDVDNIFSKRGWVKVKRELTVKEFETFEVVIQSFNGPIEDLIIAVKEIEKV